MNAAACYFIKALENGEGFLWLKLRKGSMQPEWGVGLLITRSFMISVWMRIKAYPAVAILNRD